MNSKKFNNLLIAKAHNLGISLPEMRNKVVEILDELHPDSPNVVSDNGDEIVKETLSSEEYYLKTQINNSTKQSQEDYIKSLLKELEEESNELRNNLLENCPELITDSLENAFLK